MYSNLGNMTTAYLHSLFTVLTMQHRYMKFIATGCSWKITTIHLWTISVALIQYHLDILYFFSVSAFSLARAFRFEHLCRTLWNQSKCNRFNLSSRKRSHRQNDRSRTSKKGSKLKFILQSRHFSNGHSSPLSWSCVSMLFCSVHIVSLMLSKWYRASVSGVHVRAFLNSAVFVICHSKETNWVS